MGIMEGTEISNSRNFHKVEILKRKKWILSEFKDLKKNNTFRFYKCDGTVYKAISALYTKRPEGVLKINVV